MDHLNEIGGLGKQTVFAPPLHSSQIVWPLGNFQGNSTKEKCFLHLALQVGLIQVW